MTKLIFYKAKNGRLFDKLVAWADGGIYSHVEIVLTETPTHWITAASSPRDGGVRIGMIRKTERWDVFRVSQTPKDATPFLRCKYDWLGLWRTIVRWWPYCKRRWVCSTFAAELFGLPDPRSFGVQDFLNWVASEGAKNETGRN